MRRWLASSLLGTGVALAAYWRRLLTVDGAMGAASIGCIVFARGGVPAAATLLMFFASSSALSRRGEARKQAAAPVAQAKGARRDLWQVLANGGVAAASISLGRQRGGGGFLGALATAAADTWATELGLLSKQQPRLITTWRPVAAGTSGGITLAGLAASMSGALLVGATWAVGVGDRRGVPIALLAGVGGSLLDSWLGATMQALYRCRACGTLIEASVHRACEGQADLLRGHAWITNDTVNALATLGGAVLGTLASDA